MGVLFIGWLTEISSEIDTAGASGKKPACIDIKCSGAAWAGSRPLEIYFY